ncbi:ATP-binding protein [Duganella qianjiadongensis]|uniref:histidine kinase n=1 Tax=Duganella qianjiadongensis TaxID=2692176 RepID=A0ABW9VH31_9BURK|nr:ATP-binding protein [Duganella qianjiadongensis]MYM38816.1 HAMP domain-containing protein [Duganella qianjiadongensis]
MNRLFWRFAALVLLAITLATGAIYITFSLLFGDPLEEMARRQAAGQIFLLEQYIDQAGADEWLPRLNKVREVSAASFELEPLAALLPRLSARQRQQLLDGDIIIDAGGKGFYRRVDRDGNRYIGSEAELIHASHLPINIAQALGMEAIRFALIALFLLLPIGWWTQRHWRGLLSLSRMTDAFGQGDLAARACGHLPSSIAPLAERFNQMADRISELLEARRDLLRSVSHELRTPIARMEFSLELLRDQPGTELPGVQRRLQAMDEDVEELKTLVNELLTLTQLDHPSALPAQLLALAPLLESCTPPPATARYSRTLTADLGEIHGQGRLLARAIHNLLGNAAKYAHAEFALSAFRDGERIYIHVDDDGPGVPASARARVFEPFVRLEREQDHASNGFGLGLAICAKAIQLHGGSVTISDSPLGGARFSIVLESALNTTDRRH